MTDEDFEWFKYKYPGWYDKYGKWWENDGWLRHPNGHGPVAFEDVNYQYPHRCWTCMVPCLIREDMVVDKVDGQWRTYCSETCHWTLDDCKEYPFPSPNVTLNEMSDQEREEFVASYEAGGPGGRFAGRA